MVLSEGLLLAGAGNGALNCAGAGSTPISRRGTGTGTGGGALNCAGAGAKPPDKSSKGLEIPMLRSRPAALPRLNFGASRTGVEGADIDRGGGGGLRFS